MNKSEEKLHNQAVKYLESIGAKAIDKEDMQRSYTHAYECAIGTLFLRVDTEGTIFTLFGNFLNDIEKAKKEIGHWKHNLHMSKKCLKLVGYKNAIDEHLEIVS